MYNEEIRPWTNKEPPVFSGQCQIMYILCNTYISDFVHNICSACSKSTYVPECDT